MTRFRLHGLEIFGLFHIGIFYVWILFSKFLRQKTRTTPTPTQSTLSAKTHEQITSTLTNESNTKEDSKPSWVLAIGLLLPALIFFIVFPIVVQSKSVLFNWLFCVLGWMLFLKSSIACCAFFCEPDEVSIYTKSFFWFWLHLFTLPRVEEEQQHDVREGTHQQDGKGEKSERDETVEPQLQPGEQINERKTKHNIEETTKIAFSEGKTRLFRGLLKYFGLNLVTYLIRWAKMREMYYPWCYLHGWAIYLLGGVITDLSFGFWGIFFGVRMLDLWSSPFLSTSPRNFWSRRWNNLFHRNFHNLIFKRGTSLLWRKEKREEQSSSTITKNNEILQEKKISPQLVCNNTKPPLAITAISSMLVFLFSGLLHDEISWAAFYYSQSNYSFYSHFSNTIFFLIQGIACTIQVVLQKRYPILDKVPPWIAAPLFQTLIVLTSPFFLQPYFDGNFIDSFDIILLPPFKGVPSSHQQVF